MVTFDMARKFVVLFVTGKRVKSLTVGRTENVMNTCFKAATNLP